MLGTSPAATACQQRRHRRRSAFARRRHVPAAKRHGLRRIGFVEGRVSAANERKSLLDRVVPWPPRWQQRRGGSPPRTTRVGHHRADVTEHGIDDGPGRLDRVLLGEQPALTVERGPDEPVVRTHVLAWMLGEREFLRLWPPAGARLLADQ